MGTLSDRCEFFQAARHFSAHGKGTTADRLRRFFERIERYRQYAHRHSVDALLLYIYDDCNALAYYGVQPDGAKKTENLIALWQRAQGYAQSGDGSLYGFLQMLDTTTRLGGKGNRPPCPLAGDFVRVMTMHTSKGLEFPAVILPFLEQGLARAHDTSLPLSKTYGIGLWHFHQRSLSKQQTLCYTLCQAEKQRAETAERMRLCYVAMTRAKESLILLGQGSAQQLAAACEKPPAHAKSMLEWVLPAVALHPDGAALPGSILPSFACPEAAPGAWHISFIPCSQKQSACINPKAIGQRFVEGVDVSDPRHADASALPPHITNIPSVLPRRPPRSPLPS